MKPLSATWAEVIVGVDPDPANSDLITNRARQYWDALHPYSAGGAYVSFMMDEGQNRPGIVRAHARRRERGSAYGDAAGKPTDGCHRALTGMVHSCLCWAGSLAPRFWMSLHYS
jgi:hypothetical protein